MSLVSEATTTFRNEGADRVLLLARRFVSAKADYPNLVRTLPPPAAEIVFWVTKMEQEAVIQALHRAYPEKYTDAGLYKLLWIDPERIERVSGLHGQKRRGWVIDGDWDHTAPFLKGIDDKWDRNCVPFLDLPIPRSIHEYYVEGIPWDETQLAEFYDDTEQFERKCTKIEQLHDSITNEGFRSQRELVAENPRETWRRANTTIAPYTNEITVDISRDGEFLWNMLGRHRLSIVKVCDVERIPILVFARHREWQRLRNHTRSGEEHLEQYQAHPDLADIVEPRATEQKF